MKQRTPNVRIGKGANSVAERWELANGVPADEEFRRIDALPRRIWTPSQIERAQAKLTERLRTPNGTRTLWADQAIALSEIEWYGGTVAGVRVSGGKTSISFLAGTMLPDCPRPYLITPSKSIRTGKVAAAYKEERKHWRVRRDYSWLAYEMLQRKAYADYLFRVKPGIIILDEAHHAGRYDTARSSRIHEYIEAYPDVPVIVLTGSLIASKPVDDSLKLCYWARREHSPLPLPTAKKTQRFWRMALHIPKRTEPGALRRWAKSKTEKTTQALGRRYFETPGIVCSAGENVIGTSLLCETVQHTIKSSKVLRAFENIRNKRTVEGEELVETDGANSWQLAQTLALGFYYVYDPEPPEEWLDAYRNWASYCREHIADPSCSCDAESRVIEHIEADDAECWPLDDWREVRHTYKLRRRAVWLSRSVVDAAARWLAGHPYGILWTQYRAFGEAVAAHSGVPYYSRHAQDRHTGRYITKHPKGHPAIASMSTCSEDLDLQRIFCDNLFPAPSASGFKLEQAIARTHRFGSDFNEVSCYFWLACSENRDNLKVARYREDEAGYMTGDESRKLIIADWTEPRLTNLSGPQWAKRKVPREIMS